MDKLLDLRFVIGLFFLVVGILLLVHSFTSTGDQAVNQWCGGGFIIFSIVMLLLSTRKGSSQ
jgi:uncharacterized membrane protein HdeD (DUF308 family)